MNLEVGDKLLCSNGRLYTLGEGDGFYTFSIKDEIGNVVNLAHDYYIEDCLRPDEDDYKELCVGTDYTGRLIRVEVKELIKAIK